MKGLMVASSVLLLDSLMNLQNAFALEIIQITDNSINDNSARIDNGQAVWDGHPTGGAFNEIFCWDGAPDNSIQQPTDNAYNAHFPQIDNGQAVWAGYDGNDTEIFVAKLCEGAAITSETYLTDYLTLGHTSTFDFWLEMGIEPTEFNLDVLFFNGTEWETFGWALNFDGISTGWHTASFWVPPWLRGDSVQIMFSLYDWGQVTD